MEGQGRGADVVVVGGGIVGLATARALARRGLKPLVLEAEPELACHQTGRNSGVIHSGLYYAPGSEKARLCVTGARAMYEFCDAHGVAAERCGKLVVAVDEEEVPRLDALESRGRANGLMGLERVSADGAREREPHVRAVAGLWVPDTGITDYTRVAAAMAAEVTALGGRVRTGCRVLGVERPRAGPLALATSTGAVAAPFLVNCAGLQSDRLARLCGLEPTVRIAPFRGEYFRLVPARRGLVRNLVYPVPDPALPFLGVHLTRHLDGAVTAGPNAVPALRREGYARASFSGRDAASLLGYPGFWRLAARHWRGGLAEIHRSLRKGAFAAAVRRLVPELEPRDLVPARAGVRAQALAPDGRLVDDFLLLAEERMLHVLNAPSPAATASLAIGEELAARVTAAAA